MEKQIPKNPLLFGLYITRQHKKWAFLALYCVVIARVLDATAVLILKNFVDMLAQGNFRTNDILVLVISYPFIYLLAHIHWRSSGFVGMQWFINIRTTGYQVLYDYLSLHSRDYFNRRFAGALTNKIAHAVTGTETIFEKGLWNFFPLVFGICWYIVFAWQSDYRLGLILAGWSLFFLISNVIGVSKMKPRYFTSAETLSTLKGKFVDSLSNISLVHEYANIVNERLYINKFIMKHNKASKKAWIVSETVLSINGIFIFLFICSMLLTSVYLLRLGVISVGSVVMIASITTYLYGEFLFMGFELRDATTYFGEAKEGLVEILHEHTITDAQDAKDIQITQGEITLSNVDFQYDNKKIFEHFSLKILAGQKVGLVGRSGAGKTTFVTLLLRHYDIQKGTIKIDGNDIYEIKLDSLRKAIAFVPQDTSLFHRTIRENIIYGTPDATEKKIKEAVKLSQSEDFINALPKGYETFVGERGVRLSGGQRQRIAIARAFVKDAPIIIFDEATSSLDSQSEHVIQKSIESLMTNRTVIAIAHRLSTLKKMDRIIVIEDGEIKEDGSPDMLLKKENGIFKTLWDHQINGFIVDE